MYVRFVIRTLNSRELLQIPKHVKKKCLKRTILTFKKGFLANKQDGLMVSQAYPHDKPDGAIKNSQKIHYKFKIQKNNVKF